MVEEEIDGKMQLNQPAGHLESGESLIDAVIRETQEETAWQFKPTALVGIYRWQHPVNNNTYMRFCFTGNAIQFDPEQTLDDDIHQAFWLNQKQMMRRQAEFRSPLVLDCFNDYLAGHRYPLDLLRN
ncbi:MAG: NUDIX hydrolase [Gammaproteobacteria bacterium]|nr:MAG: NUDIX hydrolase [Gammaproteobacteria bacterium]